jgi:hypothetical protein
MTTDDLLREILKIAQTSTFPDRHREWRPACDTTCLYEIKTMVAKYFESAPQKPAPDAMRDALQWIKRKAANYAEISGDAQMGPYRACRQVYEIADKALSAPVPPPDGTLIAALRRLAIKQGVRLAYGGGHVPNGGHCILCNAEWEEPFKYNERHNPSCVLSTLTSSPAAAEPDDVRSALADRIDGYTRSIGYLLGKEICDDLRFAVLALRSAPVSAAPPVRDREATIKLAEAHLGAWLKQSDPALQLIPTAARQDIREFADAILSLPVQSSAAVGVTRETLESCKGEQLKFEEWAAKNCYDMREHPLHYLFLDNRTYAARQGWKAALEYARGVCSPAPDATVSEAWPDHPGATLDAIAFVEGVKLYPTVDPDAVDLTFGNQQSSLRAAFIRGFTRAAKMRAAVSARGAVIEAATEWFNGLDANFLCNQDTKHAAFDGLIRSLAQGARP